MYEVCLACQVARSRGREVLRQNRLSGKIQRKNEKRNNKRRCDDSPGNMRELVRICMKQKKRGKTRNGRARERLGTETTAAWMRERGREKETETRGRFAITHFAMSGYHKKTRRSFSECFHGGGGFSRHGLRVTFSVRAKKNQYHTPTTPLYLLPWQDHTLWPLGYSRHPIRGRASFCAPRSRRHSCSCVSTKRVPR